VKYKPLASGLRELAQSAEVGAAALSAAQRMSGNANAVGDATYEAAPATVTAGWTNEKRAGATVRVVAPHWKDARDRVLLRVADAMKVRGG
jgi:hypothetical protein